MANHDSAKQSLAKIADSLTVHIDSLQLWDRNPRSIKGDRFNELKARLQRQGQIKPLLVAADGKTVIGGNMRLRAMTELGINEVWISQTEAVTDKDIFDLALTDNEEFGYYEQEQVAELALELGLSPLELKSYALSLGAPTTLDLVVDKFGPEIEEDEVPEVDETETISVLGEVYQLGSHRLMCGDATSADNADSLLDGVKPALVFTDPPYGVDVVIGGKVGADFGIAKKGQYSEVIGDDTTDTAQEFYELWSSICNRQVIWGGNYFMGFLPMSDGWVIWDKRGNSGIRNTFADGEMAWCNFHTPVRIYKQLWNGMIREGESGQRVHPTQKPVGMLSKVIKDFTKGDDVVVDVFGGSGSILMAAEQTNRICYMMELDPKYCDVIRKRYAKHIGEEESWQEVTPAINVLQAA